MDAWLISIPAFLATLGAIVFVHELGHFLAARLFGVRVRVFSLGFGKRLSGVERGGTEYRLSWVPLGGYVRMGGELPEEHTGAPGDFLGKPRWQRILIYLAGPAMNVAFSVALFAGVFMHGIERQAFQELPPVVGDVEAGSPAAAAGLRPGDRIVAVDGRAVDEMGEVLFAFATAPGRPVTVRAVRDGRPFTTAVTPAEVPRYGYGEAGVRPRLQLRLVAIFDGGPADRAGFEPGDAVRKVDGREIAGAADFAARVGPRAGEEVRIEVERRGEVLTLPVVPVARGGRGLIGVRLGVYRPLPFGEAVVASVRYNVELVDRSLRVLGKVLSRDVAPKAALSGPIEIAAWSGRAARRGFEELLYAMGFLSLGIGLMNLLPIPVLDGGHVAVLLVESLLRRDLSLAFKERMVQVGFVVLLALMAVVLFFDLSKNLPALFDG